VGLLLIGQYLTVFGEHSTFNTEVNVYNIIAGIAECILAIANVLSVLLLYPLNMMKQLPCPCIGPSSEKRSGDLHVTGGFSFLIVNPIIIMVFYVIDLIFNISKYRIIYHVVVIVLLLCSIILGLVSYNVKKLDGVRMNMGIAAMRKYESNINLTPEENDSLREIFKNNEANPEEFPQWVRWPDTTRDDPDNVYFENIKYLLSQYFYFDENGKREKLSDKMQNHFAGDAAIYSFYEFRNDIIAKMIVSIWTEYWAIVFIGCLNYVVVFFRYFY
jgi:ABC-type multidrug transport system fused ATPase/permease subunit